MPWNKCKKSKKPKKVDFPAMPPQLIPICSHTALYKVEARFLGRKAPNASFNGLESIQKPLSELYNSCECDRILTKDLAREVMLVVFTSGILAVPANPIDDPIWIKMQGFRGCGAVRATPTYSGYDFIPIDQAPISDYPAIFTVVAQRGGCVPLIDCYAFSCVDDASANMLVAVTQQAFEDKRSWTESSKPPQLNLVTMQCSDCSCNATPKPFELINPEMFKKPPLQGFFYAPSSEVIRSYDMGAETELIVHQEVEEQPCQLETMAIMGPASGPPVIEVVNLASQHPQYVMQYQEPAAMTYDQFMGGGGGDIGGNGEGYGDQPSIVYQSTANDDDCQSQSLYIAQPNATSKTQSNIYQAGPTNYPLQKPAYATQQTYQPQQQQTYQPQQQTYQPQQQQTYQPQQTCQPQQQTYHPQQQAAEPQQGNGIPMVRKVNIEEWMTA